MTPTGRTTDDRPLAVLKFGSSVLRSSADLPAAAREVERWARGGARVVAVVAAFAGRTDELLEEARVLVERPAPSDLARLLSSGEREAAALFVLALRRAGLDAEHLDPLDGCLTGRGDPLDAEPHAVDPAPFARAHRRGAAVVLPGFYARGPRGEAVLLGRGGSDLTAVAVAAALGAARCVLFKESGALFERDPREGGAPRRFASLSFEAAERLGARAVQPKALRHAAARGLAFEVGALGGGPTTVVGARTDRFDEREREPSDGGT